MKKLLLLFVFTFCALTQYGQTFLTLTFKAKEPGTQNTVALDSVRIDNLSLGGDTVIYGTSPVLKLPIYVGLPERHKSGTTLQIGPNSPNPFYGITELTVYMQQSGKLHLQLSGVNGIKLAEYHDFLGAGYHRFEVSAPGRGLLLLNAQNGRESRSVKLVNMQEAAGFSRISYKGSTGMSVKSSTADAGAGFIYHLGNLLKYTGMAHGFENSVLEHTPKADTTLTFIMNAIVKLPTLTTAEITSITQTTATSGGNVTSDGGAAVTARGVCWSTAHNPTAADSKTSDGTDTGTFTSSLTGLTAGTTYYVRAYATNSAGTAYGNQVAFTTITLPSVTTNSATDITQTTATSGGNVTSDGGAAVTARGVCWSTAHNPTTADSKTSDGTGTGTFTSSLSGLTAGTTYYVRAYATNSAGTAYGNEVSFPTQSAGNTVTDIDGNVYATVTIGTKTWMAENLKTTKYNDGTSLPNVADASAWNTLTTPGYCWYNNNEANKAAYGALYNWYAVNSGKLAPAGWHVPTDAEWTALTDYLGGESAAGGKLKEAGTAHWQSPNAGATNSSGFTALPGGYRDSNGNFGNLGIDGSWWSATEYSTDRSWDRGMSYGSPDVDRYYYDKRVGFSVRCVKDDATTVNVPTVTTASATDITQTTATSGGNVTSDGGAAVTARGICWSTSPSPTTADSKTSDGTGPGTFTSSLTGLTAGTTYYVRAYATNSAGTAYGNEVSFPTQSAGNTVTDIDGNVYTTVTIGTQTWMAENLKTTKYNDGTDIPNVTETAAWNALTTPGYCWYNNDIANKATYGALYNWYAVNTGKLAPAGWHVATDADWTTLTNFLGGQSVAGGKLKEAGTAHWQSPNTGATNESGFTALSAGYRVTPGFIGPGGYGYWWTSTEATSTAGWNMALYSIYTLIGRSDNAKFCGFSVRCIKGDATTVNVPTVTTASATDITQTTATSGGNVTSDGGAAVTVRGVCWSTSPAPTTAGSKTSDGTGTGSFTSSLTGLTAGTTYYVRAYATNSAGTAYGNEVSFPTQSAGNTVTDTDGNVYTTVTIGSQTWMVENLKTTRLNDGTAIPNVTETAAWNALTTPGYCWYNNDIGNKATYGALYNWYAVNTGKLAPAGWHVATDADWKTMEMSLGMTQVQADATGNRGTDQGAQLKYTSGWAGNGNGTNSSGFAGLPGGYRVTPGFMNAGYYGVWWTSTETTSTGAWDRMLYSINSIVDRNDNAKFCGFSVRCVKDN